MVINAFERPEAAHVRRYNRRSASKVTAIVPGPDDSNAKEINIIVRSCTALLNARNKAPHQLSISHGSNDPLSYSVFFLYGNDGWHLQLPRRSDGNNVKGDGVKLTTMLYYIYKCFLRCNTCNTLLCSGCLFQRYMVDRYYKFEAEKWKCIKKSNRTLQAADYITI